LPGTWFAQGFQFQLILLPFQESSSESFHGHGHICLNINPFFCFLGRVFKVPVLFNLTEEFIFHEASVVIAVKSYEGIFYVDVGYENDLLIGRRNLVVPLFDNNCIERNGFIVFFSGIGFGRRTKNQRRRNAFGFYHRD